MKREKSSIFESLKLAFIQLGPHWQYKNPVLFVTYLGAIFTSFYVIREALQDTLSWFNLQIALWLWFTVLFANFAQSLAENRGKAQATSLREIQTHLLVSKIEEGKELVVSVDQIKKGDLIVCRAKELIPVDGEVIEGIAMVDESAITGESAPVIRESGGDRSAVTAGTKIVSDFLTIKVTAEKGNSFIDRIIHLVEGAKRKKTPNEIALNIGLSALTLIFLLVVASLKPFARYSELESGQSLTHLITLPILVSLLVCLIPTTISALLNAIGIAGMGRLLARNVVAKSGRSVEAAGDIDLLILDKTGTLTIGNRTAVAFLPSTGIEESEVAKLAQYSSLSDETPEGRSVVVLAKTLFGFRSEDFDTTAVKFLSFSAKTRMSGIDFLNPHGEVIRSIRKGAVVAITKHVETLGGIVPQSLKDLADAIAKEGGTPLMISDDKRIIGLIHLKDVLKTGIKERFLQLKKMGIKTVMVTGDNPITAAAIAAESGVDDFIAQATPELKLERIKEEQQKGHLVAMAGDGTNDAPALAQADVGVAMHTGTQASREAGNMVDLDSNPTKLIEIIEIGKQLLMTRGALTAFSIANDVAKYFAIIPALFGTLYAPSSDSLGPLSALNLMHLSSPQSAILSAIIFNALIIVLLIPLALKGVRYKARSAYALLAKNVLLYGIGGLVTPFIGIKLIDILVSRRF